MKTHPFVALAALASWSLLLLASAEPRAAGEEVTLAEDGRALLPVAFPAEASERHRAAASTLAEMLGKIAGAEFALVPLAREDADDAGPAIRLLLAGGPAPAPLERERYSLRSGPAGLTLTGATELALEHAVWDLLHRLGYRQYFPGPAWEVVPRERRLALAVDAEEAPDYASRRIWYGFGFWDHNSEAWQDWVAKNRMEGGFALNTGHAYGRLIRSRQADFDAHPEYYALVDGERQVHPEAKLCVSNPGVWAAAVAYALEAFAAQPEADSVSLDPSDGGGWCECEGCAVIGPPSDLALLLANHVAEAVAREIGPEKRVGIYAYNYHSEPPSLAVHPGVVVSAATGFIKGGLDFDQILAGWAGRGAVLGIREYYSVSTWDRDLPGAARGAKLGYLAETIPAFHARGARFLSAEASDNWGCNGLGYYFASRALWDTGEAARGEAVVEDFLARAFGPAKEPMREFYARIDGGNEAARLVYSDLLARMYRLLAQARELAGDDAEVRRRIEHLILYTRHAELYDDYRRAEGDARQAAFEAMLRHAYRIRGTHMVHSLALFRDVPNRDRAVSVPAGADWRTPEPENPWKSSEPFSQDELDGLLAEGIGRHEPVELGFEPRSYADASLVPAPPGLADGGTAPGRAEGARGSRSWFTWVERAPAVLELRVAGGLIAHYRDRGNLRIQLWQIGGASESGEGETLVAEDTSVPPDGEERSVRLAAAQPGLHRIDLDDGRDLTRVTWPEGQPMVWKMSLEDNSHVFSGRWSLLAWVPRGTEAVGLHSAATAGRLVRPDGQAALDLAAEGGAFLRAEVPPGMDGAFWRFEQVAGKVSLLTIPPYLARSPQEMLLPAEALP